MTRAQIRNEALKLPAEERLELAASLWESVGQGGEDLPLHPWQKSLLEERLAAAKEDPEGWLTWDEVKSRVLTSIGASDSK